MNKRAVAAGAVAIAILASAACSKKDAATTDTAMHDTGAAANTIPDTGAAAQPASPTLSDANIVYILDQANMADSVRGKVASTKGTSADVKQFGKMMMGEHHALRDAGQQLAKKLGVTPQAPSGDQSEAQAKQELDSLNAMKGGHEWDHAYIDYEVAYHEQVLKTATAALDAAQNAELKALIQKAAPVIQHHLDRAREIQKKLGN